MPSYLGHSGKSPDQPKLTLNNASPQRDPPLTQPKKRGVLIYRNELLERSETFIVAQAMALSRYQPTYCGLHKRAAGILPAASTAIVLGSQAGVSATLRRALYLQTGHAPGWIARLSDRRCSILHAHFALDAACALPLADKLNLPLVVTLHGYDVSSTRDTLQRSRGGRLYLRRQAALFHRAHTFICVSEFIRERALKAGFPAHKLWVHSIGVDLDKFQQDASQRYPPCYTASSLALPVILFVGRLVEKKGCIHLLRAMQIIQQTVPAQLVVIGDGPLRPLLEQAARDLGLQHYQFLGARTPLEIRSWLQQATVFSVPSVTAANGDSEGLGMVFCEAQAMGVPVVSFASGGIPEAVASGATGFLVPESDHTRLAASIMLLLSNRPLHAQMSDRARAWVAEKFDLRKQTILLENHFDSILTARTTT